MTQAPSEKQIAYAIVLASRRMFGDSGETFQQHIEREKGVGIEQWVRTRTRKAASQLIDAMLLSPVKAGESASDPNVKPERVPDPPEGVHQAADGRVYRVQLGRQTGNFYATQMVRPNTAGSLVNGVDYTNAGDKPQFMYVGRSPFRDLSDETLLTFDQAVELSAQFGFCIRCGRKLTAERSARLGIGPVCGKALHDQEKAREKETA